MGCGRNWLKLRRWPCDYSERARKDAQRDQEETGCSAKRRLAQGRPGSTVLYVLARVHVEICQAIHTIRREIYWWLLWHHSVPYQTDFRRGSRSVTTGAETCHDIGSPGANHRNQASGYRN